MEPSVIFLSDVRLSFPHIAEPQKQRNEVTGKERISYNAEFILPQTHPGWQKTMQVYEIGRASCRERVSSPV